MRTSFIKICALLTVLAGGTLGVSSVGAQLDVTAPSPVRDLLTESTGTYQARGFFIPAYFDIDASRAAQINEKFDLVIQSRGSNYSDIDTSKIILLIGPSVLYSNSLGDANEWALVDANEDWFLHSSPDMSPQTRIPLPDPFQHLFYMNVGSAGWRDFVVSKNAEAAALNPGTKGVFVDGPPPATEYLAQVGIAFPNFDAASYEAAALEFVRMIKTAVPHKLVILNTELAKPFTLAGDGGMAEGFVHFGGRTNGVVLTRAQWLSDVELIADRDFDGKYLLIGSGSLESTLPSMVEYCYASYLVGYNTRAHCFFYWHSNAEGGYGAINWFTLWELAIGEPIGDYFEADGLFRRDFTGGIVLVNPNDAGAAKTVRLNGTYLDSAGKVVTSVTLSNKTGAVLKKQAWPR